jgi:hypothetical protein
MIALSRGDIPGAWRAAQALVRMYRHSANLDELRQRKDALFLVHHLCRELRVTPRHTIVELARDVPVRDSMMACLLANYPDALADSLPRVTAYALEKILDPHGGTPPSMVRMGPMVRATEDPPGVRLPHAT